MTAPSSSCVARGRLIDQPTACRYHGYATSTGARAGPPSCSTVPCLFAVSHRMSDDDDAAAAAAAAAE